MSQALTNALEVFLMGLLTVLGKFIIDWINIKREEVKLRTENELTQKYLDMAANTVINCVIATNQTYVDSLKNRDAFTKEAQLEAFNKTLEAVTSLLGTEALTYLNELTGDANKYLTTLIEAEVAKQKQKGSN